MCKTTRRLSITRKEGAGAMMSSPLVNGGSQTAAFLNFHILFYYMAEVPSSTLVAFFNFNPRRQLHPSSPSTSILVANFTPRRQLQPSSSFNFQTLSLFYFLPFSLMLAVCLMHLLPYELVT
jgi:hypothetical protein